MGKVIGIDLGTTNSVVAVMEGGSPKVLVNSQGGRLTPSVVGFTEKGEQLVGQLAKHQQVTNPENTVYSIKRFIGRRRAEVASEEKLVPYKIVGSPDEPAKVEIRGKQYTPQEISARVLMDLKKAAEDYLGEKVTGAVITVPAYFNDAQRAATKEAGEVAGLKVERVLPEPTAAAIAFGLDKKKSMKIAVFDLGGGTFDISILETGDGVFQTLSISGDAHLGGDDYDQVLVDHLAEEFRKREGVDLRKDPMSLQRLKEEAEKCKKALSDSLEYQVNLPFITAVGGVPKHMSETVSRAKFESLSSALTERCRRPVLDALRDAGLKPAEVDEVVLVGGSTRMPAVQRLVKELFGKEPNRSVNPDEVVAVGAALQAAVISGEGGDMVVVDVTPLSLGVETLGGVMTVMVPRNTVIPTSKTETYSTAADNQSEVTIRVFQGERQMARDNRLLGEFNLQGIPPAPRGMPKIQVTFDIDVNGILHVTAKDQATGKENKIRVEGSTGLSDEQIKRMTREAEEHAEEDKKRRELVESKNKAEVLIYETEKSMKEYGERVPAATRGQVEQAVNNLREALKGDDLTAISRATDGLNEAASEIGKLMYEAAAKQAEDVGSAKAADSSGQENDGSGPGGQAEGGNGTARKSGKPGQADVIDAEYEVK